MNIKNKIKLVCLASVLSITAAHATSHCNGFEIKIKNNLPDNLLATRTHMNGADMQPGMIAKLDAKSAVTFTLANTTKRMNGEFIFRTVSIPSREIAIKFDLKNALLVCEHSDKTGKESGGYPIDKSRSSGKVTYTIGG